MVVGFTTTCAVSAYQHYSCEFEPRSWRGVFDTTLYDQVCQWLATDQWFSSGTPVSSTNKTGCLDITEILLKVALNTITPLNPYLFFSSQQLLLLMLLKESLNSDSQQFHQYQQSEQTTSHIKSLNIKKRTMTHVWHWESEFWLGTGKTLWQG
jgi:hypothetical protein